MLFCCNCHFRGSYFFVLSNTKDYYRKVEFGICPRCGINKFVDYRIVEGSVKQKFLKGKEAYSALEKVLKTLAQLHGGTKSNQNYYFGDFKKTTEKDAYGNPVYLQLRKNFNDEFEILGKVKTKIFKINGDSNI